MMKNVCTNEMEVARADTAEERMLIEHVTNAYNIVLIALRAWYSKAVA